MDEMKIYKIETRNGTFVSIGENEQRAKVNFTIEFPNEKIRMIKEHAEKAIWLLYSDNTKNME